MYKQLQFLLFSVLLFAAPLLAQQGFFCEYYANIEGTAINALTTAPAFPDLPTREEIISGPFETASGIGDYYGQRVRALLTPTINGNYTFYIASDDNGELWFGPDGTPNSRQRIATVNNYTDQRQWNKESNQASAARYLIAGQTYYLEALQKEHGGGDHLSIGWTTPQSSTITVIPANVIRPYLDPPTFSTQPRSIDIEQQWIGHTITFTATVKREFGVSYQWQRNGVNIPGATAATYSFPATQADAGTLFRCMASNLTATSFSDAITYRFVADHTPPTLTNWHVQHNRRLLILTFSEPLTPTTASGAFTITGNQVLSATLFPDASRVLLELAQPLVPNSSASLSLTVQDCATPPNTLTLNNYIITPTLAAVPHTITRGGTETIGPSSRRTTLVVSEINHTPAPTTPLRDLRFVELYNANPFPQSLAGYTFSGVFDYTFPAGTTIPAQGYLVIAPVPADIQTHYQINNVMGGFAADLFTNKGSLTLQDELGAWLTTIDYGKKSPWPTAASAGHSMVLARPSYGEITADGWAASAAIGGSPGRAEPPRPTTYASIVINEVLAHSGATPGFIELHNLGTAPVNLAQCVLKGADLTAPGFTLPPATTIPALGFLSFSEHDLGFKINGAGETIWLLAPANQAYVIDVASLDEQESGVAHGRFPDGNNNWRILTSPTPGLPNAPRQPASVILNEIMYHPITDTKAHEFVELYNTTTQNINLQGWKLGGDISLTFGNVTIPALGYLVVARDLTALNELYPNLPHLAPEAYSGKLPDSRGIVKLSKPVSVWDTSTPQPQAATKNTVIEFMEYRDGGAWHDLTDGGGSSLERRDPRADPALAASWQASDESNKSAWTTVEFSGRIDNGSNENNGTPNKIFIGLLGAGECLIDHVELFAANGNNLINNPSFENGAANWSFFGTHDASTVIDALGAPPDGNRVLHLRATGRLDEAPNAITGTLYSALPKSGNGTIRARVRWLAGCPELLLRARGNWIEAHGIIPTTFAFGTPGAPNSHPHSVAPPSIHDVTHRPILPRNGEKVAIYARIDHSSGRHQAWVDYRVDGQNTVHTLPMTPASGGFYTAELPTTLPSSALVEFTVHASADGSTHPQASFPNAPERTCLVRYNEPLDQHNFGIYRFWMNQATINLWAGRMRASNTPLPATFIYHDERVVYDAGIMYAGSPFHSKNYSAPFTSNNTDYKAVFAQDNLVLDDNTFVLATPGQLGNDSTAIREPFCYALGQALGLPHVHRRFVHLFANGLELSSRKIYENTEKPNGSFLSHWFPERDKKINELYKIDDWFEFANDYRDFDHYNAQLRSYTTLTPSGQNVLKRARYRWSWLKRSFPNLTANDYTQFFGLVEALNDTSANYLERVEHTINLEQFVGAIVLNHFIGNFDAYGFDRGKNMYLYRGDNGWQLIPWDMDYNFGQSKSLEQVINPVSGSFSSNDPTMKTFLRTPAITRVFWRCVIKLVAAARSTELRADMRARSTALQQDGATIQSNDCTSFFNTVDTRCNHVVEQLNDANAAYFTVNTPATPFSTSATQNFKLSGVAPFSVTTIKINGHAVKINWDSPINWSTTTVLQSGNNPLTIAAYDEENTLIGSAQRTVTYNGPALDTLQDSLVISEIMANPAHPGHAFIEVANRSAHTTLTLNNVYLAGAIDFNFPEGLLLAPGAYLLIAANAETLVQLYPQFAPAITGNYQGQLPTAAGTVQLWCRATDFEPDDLLLDAVHYAAAPQGSSIQRLNLHVASQRACNWDSTPTALGTTTTNTVIAWNHTWHYYATGNPGNGWQNPSFNDSTWLSGPSPLGYEPDPLPMPIATPHTMIRGRNAYYYRTTFAYHGDPTKAFINLSYMIDDGAVYYLNGVEIHRTSLMPAGTITDSTVTRNGQAKQPEGEIEGPFNIPTAQLLQGNNCLAVSVHQNQPNSSDLVFATQLQIYEQTIPLATPGTSNQTSSTLPKLPNIWLNELQTRNLSGPVDNTGSQQPWLELYNADPTPVSLDGWRLSTAPNDPGWTFPAHTTIAPQAYLLVWLDGRAQHTTATHLHTSFRFEFTSGTLWLYAPGDETEYLVDQITITASAPDAAWGAWPQAPAPHRWLNPPTPAAPNQHLAPPIRIVINEFMAQNDLFINPLSGDFDDWFELFNDGTSTVDLSDWVVTDTLTGENPPTPDLRPSKSLILPAGLTLLPGATLRIWTGAKNSTGLPLDFEHLQAPFGLSKSADQICLFTPEHELHDRLSYNTEQFGDRSTGRWPNGTTGTIITFKQPTPGHPNRNPRYLQEPLLYAQLFQIPEEQTFSSVVAQHPPAATLPNSYSYRLHPLSGAQLPDYLDFNQNTGRVTWTPDEAQGPGLYHLRLCLYDTTAATPRALDESLLTFNVLETTRPPLIQLNLEAPSITVNEGRPVTFTVTTERQAEIPARTVPPAVLTLTGHSAPLPPSATFDATTGLFYWLTDEPDGPTNLILRVQATDPDDPTLFTTQEISITVNEVNQAFTYASPTDFYLWHNEPFATYLRYDDPDLPPNLFTYSLLAGSPPGLSLDSDSGLLTWHPDSEQVGTFPINILTRDNAGAMLRHTIRLHVDNAHLAVNAIANRNQALTLHWHSKPHAHYIIEQCTDLNRAQWEPLTTQPGTGTTISFTIPAEFLQQAPQRFFRIRQIREQD